MQNKTLIVWHIDTNTQEFTEKEISFDELCKYIPFKDFGIDYNDLKPVLLSS